MKCNIVETQSLTGPFITQKKLACYQHPVFARFVLTFDLWLEPAATCLYLRYSASYMKIKLWQYVTFEDEFIKLKSTLP